MSKWAILLLFIISYVSNGLGIKCWSCRSSDDPKCGDPFDNSTLPFANCNQQGLEKLPETKNSVCRKIRQKVNGDWNYIRDCAYIDVDIQGNGKLCEMRSGTNNTYMEYCICNTKDGCNSSPFLNSVPILIFLSSVLSMGI